MSEHLLCTLRRCPLNQLEAVEIRVETIGAIDDAPTGLRFVEAVPDNHVIVGNAFSLPTTVSTIC